MPYKNLDMKEMAASAEKKIRKYWQDNDIAQKSIDNRQADQRYVFFEGPPTANGRPGVHHVISRAIKDAVCRYKTMQGYLVNRKAGWDTHGLPVEIEVQKTLGLRDKDAVEEYGLEKFCKACKASVFSYEKEWQEMTKAMGYWIDLENPYITLTNNYIETVWWLLNEMFKKDLIYKGYKIVPYSPSSGTPLSSHEVAQGYKEVEDPSVFVRFPLKDTENTYFLAWTTTPWTLISNVALVVHPDECYVKVEHKEQYLILAKALLRVLDGEYTIIEEYQGKDLEYKEYIPLFDYVKPSKKAYYVACGEYVTMGDGTGIVHTAPAFGQDDYDIGMAYGLPVLQPVDGAGKFTAEITPWAGVFVKDADKGIIRDLKERGLLYKRLQIKHNYPHDWRTGEPLIYYARSSWYIKTGGYKEQLIKNNQSINWQPSFVGEKRFGDWLNNNVDWALSRDRFWGTPLNVWVCPETNELASVGSIEELIQKGKMKDGSQVPADIELHRPYIDDVVLTSSQGKPMYRTPEVIDCWFDSGSMPFAQWHYPFENKEEVDNGNLFPADFISEGIDQTRGWFYSLLAISTIIKGVAPYKNVLVNDLILDKTGQKMSKSKGNSVNPMEQMDKYGADAVRWYLLSVSPPWLPTRYDEKGVDEVVKKFIITLKNVYSFYATYANIDNFDHKAYDSYAPKAEIDTWIISRLNTVIKSVTAYNDAYDFTAGLRLMQSFVLDDVSNWYVRRCRRRFWSMELSTDKIDAYLTLHKVMSQVCKLIAPFAPHISEELYMNLTGGESVHLCNWTKHDEALIKPTLEAEMRTVINTVSLGRAARNNSRIKVRQPLLALHVPEKMKSLVERMEDLIKEEINVKEICYISEQDNFVEFVIKPNFKTLGPKYGKQMKFISKTLAMANANEVVNQVASGSYKIVTDENTIILGEEDISISIADKEGFAFESYKELYVALDTSLNKELKQEGDAREMIFMIQKTRKESGFEIMDRINISYYAESTDINTACTKYASYIASETLMDNLKSVEKSADMQVWNINGQDVFYNIEKV